MSQPTLDNLDFTDERTPEEKLATWGFIVATSGYNDWTTTVVRPVKEPNEYEKISEVFEDRSDLKRVRYSAGTDTKEGKIYKPRSSKHRIYIHNFNSFLPQRNFPHLNSYVSYYPIRGKVIVSDELAHGVTFIRTTANRALHLCEWNVSALLPLKLHERDQQWNAWILDSHHISQALQKLNIPHLELLNGNQ